jgi:hypothetical protein
MRRLFYFGLIVGVASAELWAQEVVVQPAPAAEVAEPETAPADEPPPPEFRDEATGRARVFGLPDPIEPRTVDVGEGWSLTIAPAGPLAPTPASPAAAYRTAYDAIPFSRAEWLANASYRHDSAMALLTGYPVNGRAPATSELERYQNPRTYLRTFFPRLAPADVHYNYAYGRYQYRPWGAWGWYSW